MVRVVLIYRKQREGAYSLEELFRGIAIELRKHVEVIEYEVGNRRDILKDVRNLRAMHADIYHVTGDITYFIPLLPRRKTVLTVPDLGHYLFGLHGFKRWVYKWIWLQWPIRTAYAVTAISRETQNNMVSHLGVSRNHIEMIECCHSESFIPVICPFNDVSPVVLQVGTKPYKNVPRLIEALKGLPCRLVLIGSLDEEIKQKLDACGTTYENHVGLTHAELYEQYVKCDLVSFISLGEGFGVPIIEAQACGRPLITADVSPLREVAGDGACLVDPLDVSQIRRGILKIMTDPAYRGQLVEQGLRNVTRYSPAAISGQYLDLYRRIA